MRLKEAHKWNPFAAGSHEFVYVHEVAGFHSRQVGPRSQLASLSLFSLRSQKNHTTYIYGREKKRTR